VNDNGQGLSHQKGDSKLFLAPPAKQERKKAMTTETKNEKRLLAKKHWAETHQLGSSRTAASGVSRSGCIGGKP